MTQLLRKRCDHVRESTPGAWSSGDLRKPPRRLPTLLFRSIKSQEFSEPPEEKLDFWTALDFVERRPGFSITTEVLITVIQRISCEGKPQLPRVSSGPKFLKSFTATRSTWSLLACDGRSNRSRIGIAIMRFYLRDQIELPYSLAQMAPIFFAQSCLLNFGKSVFRRACACFFNFCHFESSSARRSMDP